MKFEIERTDDGRLRTRGLGEAGFHELSMKDPGANGHHAACDLLRRLGAYQLSENDAFEGGEELIDGGERMRTRRAMDGTIEVVIVASH